MFVLPFFFFSLLTVRSSLEGNMDIYEYLYLWKKKKIQDLELYWAKAMLIAKTLVHSPSCLVWWGRARRLGHSFLGRLLITHHVPGTFCGLGAWRCWDDLSPRCQGSPSRPRHRAVEQRGSRLRLQEAVPGRNEAELSLREEDWNGLGVIHDTTLATC